MAADVGRPSLLDGLKARREEILADLIKDIPAPDLPGVVFRVRPVDHAVITRQMTKQQKAKAPEAQAETQLTGFAAIIAAGVAVDGGGVVFGAGADDEEVHTLADVAGELLPDAEKASGAATVRALLLRQADVITVGRAVMEHSGYRELEADEAFAGES